MLVVSRYLPRMIAQGEGGATHISSLFEELVRRVRTLPVEHFGTDSLLDRRLLEEVDVELGRVWVRVLLPDVVRVEVTDRRCEDLVDLVISSG